MSLPVTVPFTFGNATATQSLSSLDTNFTTITNSVNGLTNGASQINVASISATGTANSTTFLRGDGVWGTPAGGGGGGNGTVTSVNVNGGSTGLTTSGGPVTTSGNITISGTLVAANGGTGLTAVGTSGNVLTSNGTAWISQASSAGTITLGTAITMSGTAQGFTSIPSSVKRLTINFDQISTNGSDDIIVQIGTASYVVSGYVGSCSALAGGGSTSIQTTGFGIRNNDGASTVISGTLVICLLNSSTNTWAASGTFGGSNRAQTFISGGSVNISGSLNRVQVTTTGGTNTFDSGTVNIMYE